MIRTYWLQTIWVSDLLLVALPFVWLGFLFAFSLPGGYARHIAQERDEAIEAMLVQSDDSREREADRAWTEELYGGTVRFEDPEAQNVANWRERVLTRQEESDELRSERREYFQKQSRRQITRRLVVAAVFVLLVVAGLGLARQSTGIALFLDRYLPAIMAVILVGGLVLFNVLSGARGGNPLGRAIKIVGTVIVAALLINIVFVPASENMLAVIYADFLADSMAIIEQLKNFGK